MSRRLCKRMLHILSLLLGLCNLDMLETRRSQTCIGVFGSYHGQTLNALTANYSQTIYPPTDDLNQLIHSSTFRWATLTDVPSEMLPFPRIFNHLSSITPKFVPRIFQIVSFVVVPISWVCFYSTTMATSLEKPATGKGSRSNVCPHKWRYFSNSTVNSS